MAGQLAGMVRKKYPGVYDDMDDISLEKAVIAKHPEYKDLVTPEEQNFTPASPSQSVTQKTEQSLQPYDFAKKMDFGSFPSAPPQNAMRPHPEAMIGPELQRPVPEDIPGIMSRGMGYNPNPTYDEVPSQAPPEHEPDTLWAGRLKGLKEHFFGDEEYQKKPLSEKLGQSPFLQSLANPQTEGDILNLLMMAPQFGMAPKPGVSENIPSGRKLLSSGEGEIIEGSKGGYPYPGPQAPEGHLANLEEIARNARKPGIIDVEPIIDEPRSTGSGITTQPRPEGPWDANIDVERRSVERPANRPIEDRIFDIAREKFNMGRDMPPEERVTSGPIIDETPLEPINKVRTPAIGQPLTQEKLSGLPEDIQTPSARRAAYKEPFVSEMGFKPKEAAPLVKSELPQPERIPIEPGQERTPFVRDASGKPPADLLQRFQAARSGQLDTKAAGFKGEEKPEDISEMRVPGTGSGLRGTLDNIAVGGADKRVLDILGTALYTRDRPSTVVKELLQNSIDEMNISGSKGPVKVAFRQATSNPATNETAVSVVVKDSGRGLSPEELYTVFSDVGKTGKGDVATAAGGFGLAKAAPLLGGEYVRVESVSMQNGKKVKYTFEGTPEQLKDKTKGVKLKSEKVDQSTPTGLRVETFFPKDKSLYSARELLKKSVTNSPGMRSVQVHNDYSYKSEESEKFLNSGDLDASQSDDVENLVGGPIPTKQGMAKSPGADIDIHFELDDKERRSSEVVYLNNGQYALDDDYSYGYVPVPGVPGKIVANIKATVEEGTDGYPFGANREELNREVQKAVHKWISDNIADAAKTQRIDELQKLFDGLQPEAGNKHVIHDSGGRYTSQELANLASNPRMREVGNIMGAMIDELHSLIHPKTPEEIAGNEKFVAAPEAVKHGFVISSTSSGGVNIPSPKNPGKYAILVNPFGAMFHTKTPTQFGDRLVHIIGHEFNHNRVRSEGGEFTWEFAKTLSELSLRRQNAISDAIIKAVTDDKGNYAPDIQELLQEYHDSRGRRESTPDLLARERESEISKPGRQEGVPKNGKHNGEGISRSEKPVDDESTIDNVESDVEDKPTQKPRYRRDPETGAYIPIDSTGKQVGVAQFQGKIYVGPNSNQYVSTGAKPIIRKLKTAPIEQAGAINEAWNLSRGLMAVDLPFITSAGLRQAMPLIGTTRWLKAWGPSFKSYNSPKAYKAHRTMLNADPLMVRPTRQVLNKKGEPLIKDGRPVFEETESIAERAGVEFTGLDALTAREEHIRSSWAEKIPVWGILVRGSNRSYSAFINDLRLSSLRHMYEAMPDKNDDVALKQIGDAINTFTGRGSMNLKIPEATAYYGKEYQVPKGMPFKVGGNQYKTIGGGTNAGLDTAAHGMIARALSQVLWSPKLTASRVQMLNPINYTLNNPQVRREYLYAAARTVAGWMSFATLAALAGYKVVTDLRNADFGKIQIGNFRLDPGASFQQLLVLMARMTTGEFVSSTNPGKTDDLSQGTGPFDQNYGTVLGTFMSNKMHPTAAYFIDAAYANKQHPFGVFDRAAQLAVPMLANDLVEFAKENKFGALAMAPLISAGMGGQYYKKGDEFDKPVFIGRKKDVTLGLNEKEKRKLR